MKLIEISPHHYVNLDAIVSVEVCSRDKMETKDIGGGLRSRPRKVGESMSIKVTTSDGKTHNVTQEFVKDVYDLLFPT